MVECGRRAVAETMEVFKSVPSVKGMRDRRGEQQTVAALCSHMARLIAVHSFAERLKAVCKLLSFTPPCGATIGYFNCEKRQWQDAKGEPDVLRRAHPDMFLCVLHTFYLVQYFAVSAEKWIAIEAPPLVVS